MLMHTASNALSSKESKQVANSLLRFILVNMFLSSFKQYPVGPNPQD